MTLSDFNARQNGKAYACAVARMHGAGTLPAELRKLLAANEHPAFVEGFADEAITLACLEEQREAMRVMMGRAA